MRSNYRLYRLVIASLTVGLAVLLVGVQAQSANQMFFHGNWNGTYSIGLPMLATNYGPYAYHITSMGPYYSYYTPSTWISDPYGCWYYGYGASPVPLWGAAKLGTATPSKPSGFGTGFTGRYGCDVRAIGIRPATKSNPVAPNWVAAYFAQLPPNYTGWGYGYATVTTAGSAPRAFTIPADQFRRTDTYIQYPAVDPYVQWTLFTQRYNNTGNFGPGLSMGNTTVAVGPRTTGPPTGNPGHSFAGKVKSTAGTNQFGGTMSLLGTFNEVSVNLTANSLAYNFWYRRSQDGYGCVGAGIADQCINPITSIYRTGTFPSPLTTTTSVMDSFSIVGFPWGTGMLTLTQRGLAGTSPWFMTTEGYDNRTSGGLGNIKLVTAFFAGSNQFAWSAENELVLSFVPEPKRGVMLAAGVLLLAGLAQLRLRRR